METYRVMNEDFKEDMTNLCFKIWVEVSAGDKLISIIRKESKEHLEEILATLPIEYQNMYRDELSTLLDCIILQKSGLMGNENRH